MTGAPEGWRGAQVALAEKPFARARMSLPGGSSRGKLFRRVLFGTTVATVGASFYVGYKYRPRSSKDVDFHEKMRGNDRAPDNAIEKALHWIARGITLTIICE